MNYSTMKFISQTAADANGKYTIIWKEQDGSTVITVHNLFNWQIMFFEDAQFAQEMFRISPELTCTCDEVHTCQQCHEEWQEEKKLRLQRLEGSLRKSK